MGSCTFTFKHYSEILEQATDRFQCSSFFEQPDGAARLYLRHDIDVSVKNALALAELEAEHGVKSTYFAAINSPYYNLLNDAQVNRLRQISDLGHTIGLHVDERGAYMDEFSSIETALSSVHDFLSEIVPVEKLISFHMPSQYDFNQTEKIGDFTNAYSTTFTDGEKVKYLSDSNRRWREGCFCQHLDDPTHDSYQILTHPIWWHRKQLSNKELYEKLQANNQEGLKVNLQDDIGIFADM